MSLKTREKHLQITKYQGNSKTERLASVKHMEAVISKMAQNWTPAQSQELDRWCSIYEQE